MRPFGRPVVLVPILLAALAAGCGAGRGAAPAAADGPAWAIAVHGGAGIYRELSDERRRAILDGIERALRLGADRLDGGAPALQVVEEAIRLLEDDPTFNAGRGAVLTWDGTHRLDASIMDGRDLSCGAVAGVGTVRHPITLARHVMTDTRHVLLAGAGAETFADGVGVERVPNEWFTTPDRRRALEEFLERQPAGEGGGTVGVVALDRDGHLAAGTSTGGLTGKRWDRIGDSPIVGAGTWADDRSVAVSGTGRGEEYIRRALAHRVASLIELAGVPVDEAVRRAIEDELAPGDGGLIAVDRHGRIAMGFNTAGMARGAADSTGRFEVAVGPDGDDLL